MTSLMSRALTGASALALLALGAAPASAQQVDRIVAFGDSYVDDGNLFQLMGIAPPLPYSTGRFSGGTNYVDTLSQILGAPVDNFGIGGALTNNQNTNSPLLPGFTTEWNAFLAGGGGVFPTVSGEFDEGDLLVVSVGGNDARFYQQTGGTLAGAPAAGTASAAFATAGLNALVAAGAPTISFLAGDTSLLPEIAGNTSAQAIRSAYSASFNTAMQSTLAGYAANGVIVHYLDGTALLSQVSANPAAYGLVGLACPALPNTSCIADPSQKFLFYFDQLHLTSAGYAIVAQYIAAQLTGPLTLQAPSDVGLDTAHQFGRTLSARMDLGAPRDGDMPEGLKAFVVGDAFQRSIEESSTNQDFDIAGHGVTAGVEYGFGSGVAGIAVNMSSPSAEFGTGAADVDTDVLQAGVYAGMGIAGGFAQAYAGYGADDHEVSRRGVVSDLESDVDGHHWIAGAKAGYLMPMGAVRVGPVVALDYAKVKTDGYSEEGDPVLTLNVGSIDAESLRGSIGAELRGDFNTSGIQLRPYGALVLEKELAGGDRSVSFAQTSAPGIVNTFELEDISRKAYARFTGGASAAIFNGVALDAGVSMTFGKKQGEETSGHLGLKFGF